MSTPSGMAISAIKQDDGEYHWIEVEMGKGACADLFAYMIPVMYDIAPEYAEEFEYSNWEIFSIHATPKKYYRAVYDLIMQGADRLESVKPFKAALKTALEADPRFMAKAA